MSRLMNDKENANHKHRLLDDVRAGGAAAVSLSSLSSLSGVPSATTADGGKGPPPRELLTTSRPTGVAVSSFSPSSQLVLVLRPGEAFEDLFGIPRLPFHLLGNASGRLSSSSLLSGKDTLLRRSSGSSSMDQYRALCESIVRGDAADDAQAWKDVLAMARRGVATANKRSGATGGPSAIIQEQKQEENDEFVLRPDFNLLRLHRRATSRGLKPPHSPLILDIWLSYASCQLAVGMHNDARLSLRHVGQLLESPSAGGGGGRPHADSYYLELANLLVTAGNVDGAIRALEARLERRGNENDAPTPEVVERLAQLRGGPRERAGGETPLDDGAPNQGKRRTPLSTLSSTGESKRLRMDASSPGMLSESPSTTLGDNSLDTKVMKRLPFASLPPSKPPCVTVRSTSDDTERGIAPGESRLSQFQQQRPSLRVPSAQASVPLLPKLSTYSSAPKPSSPRALKRADESSIGSSTGQMLSSISRPTRCDDRADESRTSIERSTPGSANVTVEGQDALVNHSFESVAASDRSESSHLSRTPGNFASFVQRKSDCSGTETTPSRPPLGLRGTVASSAVVQPTSATRYPTLLDRLSRGKTGGVVKPLDKRVDAAPPFPTENERPRESMEGGKNEEDSTTKSSNGDDSKSSPRKVNMDISYMWEWDPNRAVRPAPEPSADSPNASTKLSQPAKLETINEDETVDPPLVSKGDLASGGVTNRDANTSSHRENNNDPVPSKSEPEPVAATAAASASPLLESETASLLQACNRDFLPLVNEANILKVNDVPYLKLGVIGKGGSCKVYRALTKNCSVVAIKKVKLAGMDRNAINGYANEVALLKRLRGNSAIIQMIDSQLDLKRKHLFVVMEQGETDLNHVLHQQALSCTTDGKAGRRHLNMNFVRLTWHQMLSAVHCIHEARIVHGDLKPANFLFVKGALKLIDFGIAKAIQSEDTTSLYRDNQIGTLNYMSPEAISADTGASQRGGRPRIKVGRASDIWSLGCILYQMLYGQTPFAELHMIQKLHAIIDPRHAISFPDGADKDAIDAMKQCLRRKPDERAPIVGPGGLLSEHRFLHPQSSSVPPT